MAQLELSNISKSYNKVTVVQDFNIKIADGEFLTLLGPSGCGKTTTLRMVAGFTEPTTGSILLDGKPIFLQTRKYL